MHAYEQRGYGGAVRYPEQVYGAVTAGHRTTLVLPLVAGLLLAMFFVPSMLMILRQSGTFERGAVVVFFVPLVGGPLLMVGFQRPAVGMMLAGVLGLLDWRLGGRFELFGEVLGISTNPSNIFFVLLFVQSFFWRRCRRVPRVFLIYIVLVVVGGGLGLFVTADMDSSMSAYILRLIIPAVIAVHAIRSIRSLRDFEVLWMGVLLVAQGAVLYNLALGFSGERGFGRRMFGGNSFSLACACFLPIAASWGLSHARRSYRWVGRFASVLFAVQIWIQSSRTAIAVLCLFIAATAVIRFRRVLLSPAYLGLVGLVVVFGTGYYVHSFAFSSGAQRQKERFEQFMQVGIRGSNRWGVWSEAAEVAAEHPLLGTGINAFTAASWLGYYMHPHQIVLAMWLDTGLIGLLGFLMLSAYLIVTTILGASRAPPGAYRDTCWAVAAMVLILLSTLQVEGYVYCGSYLIGTWVFHLVVVSAMVAIALAREHRQADLFQATQPEHEPSGTTSVGRV